MSLEMDGSIDPQAAKVSTQRALLRTNGLICYLKGLDMDNLAPRTSRAEYSSAVMKGQCLFCLRAQRARHELSSREDGVLIPAQLLSESVILSR